MPLTCCWGFVCSTTTKINDDKELYIGLKYTTKIRRILDIFSFISSLLLRQWLVKQGLLMRRLMAWLLVRLLDP